jgi:hypothetical protein
MYAQERDGSDLLVPYDDGKEDLDVGKAWKWVGAEHQKNQSNQSEEKEIEAI